MSKSICCTTALAVVSGAAFLLINSGQIAGAQPKALPKKPIYAVATFTAPDSPNNAGNEATLHMPDWTKNGWSPVGIAAQYSEHENEGATVKGTPLWAVHVLMTCSPSVVNSCQSATGPIPPHP
jgi:hypothetical protein